MPGQPTLRAVSRPTPDFTDRSYWAGTIKMARIAWALMTRKEVYRAKGRAAEAAA